MKKVIAAVTICVLCIVAFASVTTESNRSGPYNCDGNDVTFEFDFPIEDTGDLIVILTDTTTAEPTVLTETTHYTVSATNNDYFAGPGGLVTTVSAYASGYTITIIRDTSKTHDSEYEVGGRLDTEAIGASFDKQTMMIQDLNDLAKTALRVPIGEGPIDEIPNKVERASKYAAYDPNGNPIVTEGTGDATPHTTFAAEFASKENAAEARATLDAQKQFCIDVTEAPYCAVGDGVTDDTAAVQAAMDAVWAANGGVVYAPVGTYLCNISKILRETNRTITILGSGMYSTIFKAYTSAPVFTLGAEGIANVSHNAIFRDLTIDGNSNVSHGIKLVNSAFMSFNAVQFLNCDTGAWLYGGIYCNFNNCMFDENVIGYKQEYFDQYSPNHNRITGGRFADNTSFAIYADKGRSLLISGVGIEGNGILNDSNTAAVKLRRMSPAAGDAGPAAVIEKCWFEANRGKASIWAEDCNAVGGVVIRDVLGNDFRTDYGLYLDSCKILVENFTHVFASTSEAPGVSIYTADCNGFVLYSKASSVSINSNVVQFPLMMGSTSDYQYYSNQWNFLKAREGLLLGANNATSDGMLTKTSMLDVNSTDIRIRNTKTPASSSAAGFKGTICWDASYIYVCTDANTWERSAISSW